MDVKIKIIDKNLQLEEFKVEKRYNGRKVKDFEDNITLIFNDSQYNFYNVTVSRLLKEKNILI